MRLSAFLTAYGDAISDAVVRTYPPVYDAETRRTCGFDLRRLIRKPLGAQADAIRATALSIQRQRATIVVGEMGCGKSAIAAAAAYFAGCRRVFLLCPPHLVRKWRREIEGTVPGARVAIVRTIRDLERSRDLGGSIQFVICSREQAKLGYRWRPAVVTRIVRGPAGAVVRDETGAVVRLDCCPSCFAPIVDDEGVPLGVADLAQKKRRCQSCHGALWQADRTGPRRVALADYVLRRMRGHFDLLIADECFPAGTLIATPDGPRPIEQLRVGDRVRSYRDGTLVERTVVRTIRKRLRRSLVCVWHEGGSFTCTSSHRIYTTAGNSLEAGALAPGTPLVFLNRCPASPPNEGATVADHREPVPALPEGIHLLAAPQARATVLQESLRRPGARREAATFGPHPPSEHYERVRLVRRGVRAPSIEATHLLRQALLDAGPAGLDGPAVADRREGARQDAPAAGGGVRPDAPNERKPGDPQQGISHEARASVPGFTRRERCPDGSTGGTPERPGLVCGVLHPDGTQIVALCESGSRRADLEARGGGGRRVSPFLEAAESGFPEDWHADGPRLEGAPLLELGDRPGSGGSGRHDSSCRPSRVIAVERLTSEDEFVYDLEIDDTHCYFADGILVSNCHELKARGSGQGLAGAALAEACAKTLVLSGTLMGGYASSLFHLLYRFGAIKGEFDHGDEAKWVARYGYLARITKRDPDARSDDGRQSKRRTYLTRVVERPGVTPPILFHLIGNTVFLRLRDVARHLPDYQERVQLIPLDERTDADGPSQARSYRRLATDLRAAVRQALRAGSKRLLGTYLQALLAYPDACTREETVLDPSTNEVLGHAPALPEGRLYPKERALVELVQRERGRGRRVLVYVTHTNLRDVTPRLQSVLEEAGFRVAVLKADTVPAERREDWVAARVREGVDVLVTNPRLVQTGLDLIDFPSVVWVEVDYSVYVLRQASRRSWRIGQRQPVEVTFLTYGGTLQAEALGLVAAKTRASLMVEGELPEEGLAAVGEDGEDVYLALARRLAETGEDVDDRAHSLEALFADAQRSEHEADELLVDGDWQGEAEVQREPVPLPVVPAPVEIGPLDGLPLFANEVAVPAPASVAKNGKVVTLEELAQLLRRRKSRPRSVPEGQLALFVS